MPSFILESTSFLALASCFFSFLLRGVNFIYYLLFTLFNCKIFNFYISHFLFIVIEVSFWPIVFILFSIQTKYYFILWCWLRGSFICLSMLENHSSQFSSYKMFLPWSSSWVVGVLQSLQLVLQHIHGLGFVWSICAAFIFLVYWPKFCFLVIVDEQVLQWYYFSLIWFSTIWGFLKTRF